MSSPTSPGLTRRVIAPWECPRVRNTMSREAPALFSGCTVISWVDIVGLPTWFRYGEVREGPLQQTDVFFGWYPSGGQMVLDERCIAISGYAIGLSSTQST